MANPNVEPIYSKVGAIGQSFLLTTAANDYNGVSPYNKCVFVADASNGGFVQRLRFKARGSTGGATVARIYINRGTANTNFSTGTPAAPTGVGSNSGGTMIAGAYFATVVGIGPDDSQTPIGTYSASVSVASGVTGSITWTLPSIAGAESYRVYVTTVGAATGTAQYYFSSATTTFVQTAMPETGTLDDPLTGSQFLFGEITLASVTSSTTAATAEIDYPLNLALPPGYTIYVGLSATVTSGWQVSCIGGSY